MNTEGSNLYIDSETGHTNHEVVGEGFSCNNDTSTGGDGEGVSRVVELLAPFPAPTYNDLTTNLKLQEALLEATLLIAGKLALNFQNVLRDPSVDFSDIASISLIKIYRSFQKWGPDFPFGIPGALPSYLYRTVTNVYLDAYRKTQRRGGLNTGIEDMLRHPYYSYDFDGHLIDKEYMEWLLSIASESLGQENYDTLILVYFYGLRYVEVAEVMKVQEGTVKSRLSRGLASLREALQQQSV